MHNPYARCCTTQMLHGCGGMLQLSGHASCNGLAGSSSSHAWKGYLAL